MDDKPLIMFKFKTTYGSPYMIFQTYPDNIVTTSHQMSINYNLFKVKTLCRKKGMPLYDMSELLQAIERYTSDPDAIPGGAEAAEKVEREGGRVEVLGVSIKVFNHADGELHDLVVGLSVGSIL